MFNLNLKKSLRVSSLPSLFLSVPTIDTIPETDPCWVRTSAVWPWRHFCSCIVLPRRHAPSLGESLVPVIFIFSFDLQFLKMYSSEASLGLFQGMTLGLVLINPTRMIHSAVTAGSSHLGPPGGNGRSAWRRAWRAPPSPLELVLPSTGGPRGLSPLKGTFTYCLYF